MKSDRVYDLYEANLSDYRESSHKLDRKMFSFRAKTLPNVCENCCFKYI